MNEREGGTTTFFKQVDDTHNIRTRSSTQFFVGKLLHFFVFFFVFLPSIQPRVQKNYSAIHRRRRDTNEMEIIEKGVLNREIDF